MAKENKAKKATEKIGKVKFITEFKAFISRGNVLDMAVGMIVGSAFTAIITALVNKVLMPALGMLTGGIDFKDLKIILKEAVLDVNGADPTVVLTPEVSIGYGEFIAAIINFFLIAISVFILIKVIGSFKRKKVEEPAPVEEPKPDPQIELLTEIRDLLKGEKATEEEKEAETV